MILIGVGSKSSLTTLKMTKKIRIPFCNTIILLAALLVNPETPIFSGDIEREN